MSQYYSYTRDFNKTTPANSTDKMIKYRDIISPHRTETLQFNSRDRLGYTLGSSFRELSRETPARQELMERSRNRKSSQTLQKTEDQQERLEYNSSLASRSKYNLNPYSSYHGRAETTANERVPRSTDTAEVQEQVTIPVQRKYEIPVEASIRERRHRPLLRDEPADKEKTPPRGAYRLHIRNLVEKEDTSKFSEKILNILDSQQQQLKVIMSEMHKVSSIVASQHSASASKKAALSADGQNSEIQAGSTQGREFMSMKNEPIKSGTNWIKDSRQGESSEVSQMENLHHQASRSKKQLFLKKQNFDEDSQSRQESSPISKLTADAVNVNDMSDSELMELKKKIDSRLSQASEEKSRQSRQRDHHLSAGSFLKKLANHPATQKANKPQFSGGKPPLSMSHRKPPTELLRTPIQPIAKQEMSQTGQSLQRGYKNTSSSPGIAKMPQRHLTVRQDFTGGLWSKPMGRVQMSTSQPVIKPRPPTAPDFKPPVQGQSREREIPEHLQESTATGYQESDSSVLEIQQGMEEIEKRKYPLLYDILRD